MSANRDLIDHLRRSRIYQDYESAFTEATGLPVSLRPAETWQLPHRGRKNESRFCAMMSEKSGSCAACLRVQDELTMAARHQPASVTCFAGMCDTAVPVRSGDSVIGFLQTGQVFRRKPTEARFEASARQLSKWGVGLGRAAVRELYFATRVVTPKRYAAMISLLHVFAQHLSIVSNQVLLQQQNAELPVISSAKEYIDKHQGEKLSLAQVAKSVNMSTFYFCKIFHKATGVTFTDYVSRVRIEKSKNLLLNRNLRVSEIAFEVGFQSLTHFNRVFKNIVGQSPTEYRVQLSVAA